MLRFVLALSLASAAAQFPMENGSLAIPSTPAGLARVAEFMKSKPYVTTLRIECHTDGSGDARQELARSRTRAHAIARKLVDLGVPCERLLPVGLGPDKPVAAKGSAANRRDVFTPAALRGKAIGGMPLDGGGLEATPACEE